MMAQKVGSSFGGVFASLFRTVVYFRLFYMHIFDMPL
jgi:hypothetical protein